MGFILKAVGLCLIAVWFYRAFAIVVHNQKVIAEALDRVLKKLGVEDDTD